MRTVCRVPLPTVSSSLANRSYAVTARARSAVRNSAFSRVSHRAIRSVDERPSGQGDTYPPVLDVVDVGRGPEVCLVGAQAGEVLPRVVVAHEFRRRDTGSHHQPDTVLHLRREPLDGGPLLTGRAWIGCSACPPLPAFGPARPRADDGLETRHPHPVHAGHRHSGPDAAATSGRGGTRRLPHGGFVHFQRIWHNFCDVTTVRHDNRTGFRRSWKPERSNVRAGARSAPVVRCLPMDSALTWTASNSSTVRLSTRTQVLAAGPLHAGARTSDRLRGTYA